MWRPTFFRCISTVGLTNDQSRYAHTLSWASWSNIDPLSFLDKEKPIFLCIARYNFERYHELLLRFPTGPSRHGDHSARSDSSLARCPLEIEAAQSKSSLAPELRQNIDQSFKLIFLPHLSADADFHLNRLMCLDNHSIDQQDQYKSCEKNALHALAYGLRSYSSVGAKKQAELNSLSASFRVFLAHQYVTSGYQSEPTSTNKPYFRFDWIILTPDGYPLIGLPKSTDANQQCDFENLREMIQHTIHGWRVNSIGLHHQAIKEAFRIRMLEKDKLLALSKGVFKVVNHAGATIMSVVSALLYHFETDFGPLNHSRVLERVQRSHDGSIDTTNRRDAETYNQRIRIGSSQFLCDFLYYVSETPQTLAHKRQIQKTLTRVHSALCHIAECLLRDSYSILCEADAHKIGQIGLSLLCISKAICLRSELENMTSPSASSTKEPSNENSQVIRDRSPGADECSEDLVRSSENDIFIQREVQTYSHQLHEKCSLKASELINTLGEYLNVRALKKELSFDDLPEVYPSCVMWSVYLRCLLRHPNRSSKERAIVLVDNLFLKKFVRLPDFKNQTGSRIEIRMLPISSEDDQPTKILGLSEADAPLYLYASAQALFIDAYEYSGRLCFLQNADLIQEAIDTTYFFSNSEHDIYMKVMPPYEKRLVSLPGDVKKGTLYPFLPLRNHQSAATKLHKSGTYVDVEFYPNMLFPVVYGERFVEDAVALTLMNSIRLIHMHPDDDKYDKIEKLECTFKRSHSFLLQDPLKHASIVRPLMYYFTSFSRTASWKTIFIHRTAFHDASSEAESEIEELFDKYWPAEGFRTVIVLPNGNMQEQGVETEFLFHPFKADTVYTNNTKSSPRFIVTQSKKIVLSIDSAERMKEKLMSWGVGARLDGL